MPKNKKNTKNKKIILVSALVLVLAAGSGLAYWALGNDNSSSDNNSPNTAQESDQINYDPPTDEEKQEAQNNKENIARREAQNSQKPPVNGKKPVTPVITYAAQYGSDVEVGGYVSGVFEENGTCIATFTKDSKTFSRSVQSVRGANSNDCPAIVISTAEFSPKGKWSVKLSYESPASSGSSASQDIEVK